MANDTGLRSTEVEAIRIGLKALPDIIRNLVVTATSSKSESQRRQASEVLLRHIMADRQQQFEVSGQLNPNGGQITQNISLTKVDARLVQVMDQLPVELQQKYAEVTMEISNWLSNQGVEVYEGEIVEDVITGPTCECGCGHPVNRYQSGPKRGQYARFVRGHHLKKHVSSPAVIEARKHSPQENIAAKRAREALGAT